MVSISGEDVGGGCLLVVADVVEVQLGSSSTWQWDRGHMEVSYWRG